MHCLHTHPHTEPRSYPTPTEHKYKQSKAIAQIQQARHLNINHPKVKIMQDQKTTTIFFFSSLSNLPMTTPWKQKMTGSLYSGTLTVSSLPPPRSDRCTITTLHTPLHDVSQTRVFCWKSRSQTDREDSHPLPLYPRFTPSSYLYVLYLLFYSSRGRRNEYIEGWEKKRNERPTPNDTDAPMLRCLVPSDDTYPAFEWK